MESKNRVARPLALGTILVVMAFSATVESAQPAWKKTPCKSNAMSHNIEVGPDVSCKLAFVSKGAQDSVSWKSVDSTMPYVKIEFQWPNPFQRMTDCDGTKPICKADGLAAPADDTKIYLYTASICDGATPANCVVVTDPGIIIKP